MFATIPNVLTIARVAAAPMVAIVFAIFDRGAAGWLAFLIFTFAALTDFLDGWLARRLGQVSAFGRMLDSIADKALTIISAATLLGLYGLGWTIVVPVAAIILREVLISGLREFLKGAAATSVTRLAKWKTTCQLIAIGALLFAGPSAAWGLQAAVETAGLALLWLAAALTMVTGWNYLRRGWAYIEAEERAS